MDLTVPGGEDELVEVYNTLVRAFRDLDIPDFPIVESGAEVLDGELLDDLARLWPSLPERA